jgi:uncharacterized protein (DUF2062 family)
MRIDTNKMIITLSLLIGIFATFLPFFFIPYLLFVVIALFIRGFNEQETK